MCVIYIALGQHPDHPLILLANRDEYYDRPSLAATYWADFPYIYGGRDLAGGGTWLGVTKQGRFAAVTNYRDPAAASGVLSRGNLVAEFLKSDEPARSYLERVKAGSDQYSGFNLIVGELDPVRSELHYFSNRGSNIQKLRPGICGLSNHLLDTPWPKVARGKARFADLLGRGEIENEKLFEVLADESLADDSELPSTGIPYAAEKAISAIFIKTAGYGTRCSTVLKFGRDFEWNFEEKVFV